MALRSIHIQYFKGLTDVTLSDCAPINVLVGKNNSGKSSLLHAIEMVGLAFHGRNWGNFRLMLAIEDLFTRAGPFAVELEYADGREIAVRSREDQPRPVVTPDPDETQQVRTILVWPEGEAGLVRRRHLTPRNVVDLMEIRQFGDINGLDILHALKYYGGRNQRGLTIQDYEKIIEEVRRFFPDLQALEADRTDQDIATVTYEEYGGKLDILYAGGGLKHLLDILIKITFSQAEVVLLDEPEAGMHPELQRKFLDLLVRLCDERGLQFFLSTHSPVFLTRPDKAQLFRVTNVSGRRSVTAVPEEAIHTIWGDCGIRPGDLLQSDIAILVEGMTDAVFLDYVISELYASEFEGLVVRTVQFGGDAANGIVDGTINLSNINPAQGYCLWIRDRDSAMDMPPKKENVRFINAVKQAGQQGYIWNKREIEYYFPQTLLVAAQDGNKDCEETVRTVLTGDQSSKFNVLAKGCCVPKGSMLRDLLGKHLTNKDSLDPEVKELIEGTLLPWADEIRGEQPAG